MITPLPTSLDGCHAGGLRRSYTAIRIINANKIKAIRNASIKNITWLEIYEICYVTRYSSPNTTIVEYKQFT